MPEPRWRYLRALRYFPRVTTWSAIADAFDSASHDRWTRLRRGIWSGHSLLNLALRALFTVAGGYLIVDDTGGGKTVGPLARRRGVGVVEPAEAGGMWGLPRVACLDGGAGPARASVAALAERGPLDVRSGPRVAERCPESRAGSAPVRPVRCVVSREATPQTGRDSGWSCVCPRKNNRRFEGRPLCTYLQHPSWQATGSRAGR